MKLLYLYSSQILIHIDKTVNHYIHFRLYTLGLPKSEPVSNEESLISTPEGDTSSPGYQNSGSNGHREQSIIDCDTSDLNLSNDISELFNFIPITSNVNSYEAESKDKQYEVKEARSDSFENSNCNSYKRKRTKEKGDNGQPIVMKSSQNFPITDSLKDIILDLDIGNSVS